VRHAILGDVHANLAAFEAVLEDMEARGGFDELWCLGDVVGYGPDPHACIELLRRYKHICVAGNHDLAAIGRIDASDFNREAARACEWTTQQLSAEDVDYLRGLPLRLERGGFTLVHGSPRQPVWEYVTSAAAACDNFPYFGTDFCLVGHSHIPLVFRQTEDGRCYREKTLGQTSLTSGQHRLIINPGAVGQPRDGDPRASYAVYDSSSHIVCHYRASYDVTATQKRMVENKLPLPLVLRLNYGY